MAKHNYIGKIGEQIACKFLKSKGFLIMDTNYRKKWGEIDIVAKKSKKLYFMEVKTVSREKLEDLSHETNDFYRPEDNMHPWKINRLSRAIQSYLAEKEVFEEIDWQLDLITVRLVLDAKKAKVDRLENISISSTV